ncbi:MAG TPA: hypothetical protein VGL86_21135 [Polyangia bacterium]
MRRVLFIAVLLGGCHFGLKGVDGDTRSGGDDAGIGGDDGSVDLAPSSTGDMGGFLPSHVPPGTVNTDAADLPLGITAIDTSALTINGASPPVGVVFQAVPSQDGWAELLIGGWTVDQNVKVTGTRALIVVAARKVDVMATIDGSADHLTGGPGATTAGKGGDGTSTGDNDSGGGGGGFGSTGAQGGDSTGGPAGGAAGSSYGDTRTYFGGGSSGGMGGGATGCGATEMTKGRGGAGGGAIQISSVIEVVDEATGGIDVAGGGGTRGCGSLASAAGGGGSGGLVFLEAPSVTVLGKIAANGGGGGGAGSGNGNNDGSDGDNGALSATAANGGQAGGGGFLSSSNGGDGGKGATGGSGAARGANQENGGGAGGGVGRVWLRTPTGTTPVIGGAALMSPAPTIDATL